MATLTYVPPKHASRAYFETFDAWLAWLRANALDPALVARSTEEHDYPIVVDEEARTITATCFVVVDGQKRQVPDGSGLLKEERTVSLLVHPGDYRLAADGCRGGLHDGTDSTPVKGWHSDCTFVGVGQTAQP